MKKGGKGAFWKPLFFAFPSDKRLYSDEVIDTQAMIGDGMMIAPIVEENVIIRNITLPFCRWYAYPSGKRFIPGGTLIQNQPD